MLQDVALANLRRHGIAPPTVAVLRPEHARRSGDLCDAGVDGGAGGDPSAAAAPSSAGPIIPTALSSERRAGRASNAVDRAAAAATKDGSETETDDDDHEDRAAANSTGEVRRASQGEAMDPSGSASARGDPTAGPVDAVDSVIVAEQPSADADGSRSAPAPAPAAPRYNLYDSLLDELFD